MHLILLNEDSTPRDNKIVGILKKVSDAIKALFKRIFEKIKQTIVQNISAGVAKKLERVVRTKQQRQFKEKLKRLMETDESGEDFFFIIANFSTVHDILKDTINIVDKANSILSTTTLENIKDVDFSSEVITPLKNLSVVDSSIYKETREPEVEELLVYFRNVKPNVEIVLKLNRQLESKLKVLGDNINKLAEESMKNAQSLDTETRSIMLQLATTNLAPVKLSHTMVVNLANSIGMNNKLVLRALKM